MHKLVYLVSTLRRSGPTNQLKYIISGLDRDHFEPHIVTLSPEPADSMKAHFQSMGIEIKTMGLGRVEGILKGQSVLKGILKGLGAKIVHTQGLRADLLGLGIRNIPVVTTLRNDPFEDYPAKYGKVKGGIMAWQQMRVMHKGAQVYACSRSLSEAFKQKYKLDLPWVQNGVDTDYYSPSLEGERSSARNKLNIGSDRLFAVSVGSLISRKDHTTSLRGVMDFDASAVLYILGEGGERESLENQAQSFDLRLPGQVEDIRDFLRAADVFISSSLGEGLPNTVLEALASGLPVILSDIPPHREIMENSSYSLIFNAGEAEALASRLEELKTMDQKVLRADMRAIAEQFSAKRMSATYQDIYRKLLQ